MSPLKRSQSTSNEYFDAKLQMKDKTLRAVCFSPDKHKCFKAKSQSSSPLKISGYRVKRNIYSDTDEIHINKRTKLADPNPQDVDFNIAAQQEATEDLVTLTSVKDIVKGTSPNKVNIAGRVTFQNNPEILHSNGKTLTKQESTLTDETGSIRLVLWENDIGKVKSGNNYHFISAIVKSFQQQKYITLNRHTVTNTTDIQIERNDEEIVDKHVNKVNFPAEGVSSVSSYHCCYKCQSGLPSDIDRRIIQCTNCGFSQLRQKCKKRTFAKVLFKKGDDNVTINIFDDKLFDLYELNKTQYDHGKSFGELTDDDIIELLLTAEATVCYNSKKSVISVKQKSD